MPKYDGYKDSKIEWIGDIPKSWDIKKLPHLFPNIGSGTTPSSGNAAYYGGSVNWLQTGDLTDGFIDDTSKKLTKKALKSVSSLKQYEKGSVVVAMYGATIGKLGLLKVKTTTNQACCVIEASDVADMRFVFYLFYGFRSQIISMGYGGGQPNISQDLIRRLRLPFPLKDEQTAIANFLDQKTTQINEAIAIKEKQIALLKERKQIIIQQAVTGEIVWNEQAKAWTEPAEVKDSGVDWIGEIPKHWEVRRSKFLFTQRKERAVKSDVQLSATQAYGVIPQSEYEELSGNTVVKIQFHLDKRKHVEKNDFVISMRSFQGGLERAWSSGCIRSSYIVLRPLEQINPDFYGYLLKLPSYIKALQRTGNFIRDGQDLNFDNFSQVDLFIPPLDEQEAIANYVKEFMISSDKGIELLHQQVKKLKEYKTTLINSAVTGKIKVA